MEAERIGLADQFLIACFKPSKYGEFLKLTRRQIVQYIFCLVTFLVIIEHMVPLAAWNYSVGGIESLLTERVPAFELKDGNFKIAKPVSIAMDGALYISADDSVEEVKEKDFKDNYATQVIVGKKNLMILNGSQAYSLDFKSLKDRVFTNKDLVAFVPSYRMIMVISFVTFFFIRLASFLFFAVFYALMTRSGFRTKSRFGWDFNTVFVLAIFGSTFGTIVSGINTSLGYPADDLILAVGVVTITLYMLYKAQKSIIEGAGNK